MDESFILVNEYLILVDESFILVNEYLILVDESLILVDESFIAVLEWKQYTIGHSIAVPLQMVCILCN